jgi:hypothetical protein
MCEKFQRILNRTIITQLILFGPAIISVDVTFVNKGYATIMTDLPHHLIIVIATRANSALKFVGAGNNGLIVMAPLLKGNWN